LSRSASYGVAYPCVASLRGSVNCHLRYILKLTGTWSRVKLETQLDIDEWSEQKRDEHILRGHLNLVFSESVYSTESDTRVGDDGLTSPKQQKVVTSLQDSAIACWDIQAGNVVNSSALGEG